ncbi:excinuclease ABC subunit UvrA [Fluviicola taffensis]|uniref:UvrABC system protein A n=1 Tax=Fluviicola taffensis (strain DSM 16823 / NCIMB 13979 / RW262) TaxID=755732 RepID=F2IE35_FLUTR|nr:excinuclease ABC subunit UvrA [Fluviicola taffensis]AEA45599.1 excinuclease ABC, A subunit [Fluviicola taffensis DSM 16823]
MSERYIHIKGARVNNLKNLEVKIEHGKFTVITGLSGSGKSSLAFDTLYAEGQRRYIESLSSYARQFLGKLDKPETDFIKGIAPAIAIQQKVITNNPRSTVGTTTEIYDYLKILFARIGKTFSPISGNEVKKDSVTDVINYITTLENDIRLLIAAPFPSLEKYGIEKTLKLLKEQGYVRILHNHELKQLEDLKATDLKFSDNIQIVVDRVVTQEMDSDFSGRLGDSIQLAFMEGHGDCSIIHAGTMEIRTFSNRFELDNMTFVEPSPHLFTFNNPFGACKTCEGYGSIIGVDPNLVIPDPSLSVFEGAVVPWKGDVMSEYLQELIQSARKFDFPIHRPVEELTEEQLQLLWDGNKYFAGINGFFKFVESQSYKIQYRVLLSRYRGKTGCPECHGTRLREDANYVKVGGISIKELVLMPVENALNFFQTLEVDPLELKITNRILPEITQRLSFLCEVGLGYLTLNRAANTLSGGESQRINLATSLGSSLVGSMYILDEPSIGLHPRDTERLIGVLKKLRDLGNTVIVVEHEEDMMIHADEIIDIGPAAGKFGGEVVFQGKFDALKKNNTSLTTQYLTGVREIPVPKKRRIGTNKISVVGAKEHNLKNVSVDFPLNRIVAVTGVSGSGKSTLVKEILYPGIRKYLGQYGDHQGNVKRIDGDLSTIAEIELIDQNPIGKSSRSNPVTYVKAFDDIRELFSRQNAAKHNGYKPGFFSFNVEGGRCEMCEGEGVVTVSMQFMADVHLLCESCGGSRYRQEALEVHYRDKNISDILNMDISSALAFFKENTDKLEEKIIQKIQPLEDVGLGYLQMGQSSSSLSGGEAQRVKLASFLIKGAQKSNKTLFIFDEPTTGLHFFDIEKLLIAFNRLVDDGHSIIVIEHNMDVIKAADWIIDIGPEGGNKGGNIEFTGTPEELVQVKGNYTGIHLKNKLK